MHQVGTTRSRFGVAASRGGHGRDGSGITRSRHFPNNFFFLVLLYCFVLILYNLDLVLFLFICFGSSELNLKK